MKRFSASSPGRMAAGGLVFFAAAYGLFLSQLLFGLAVDLGIKAERVSPWLFSADISKLPEGMYYASLGSCSGYVDMKIGGETVDTTRIPGSRLRGSTFLGAPFRADGKGYPPSVEFHFHPERGNDTGKRRLCNDFVTAPYKRGLLFHFLRIFYGVILGPGLALFLVFSFFLQSFAWSRGTRRDGGKRTVAGDLKQNWPLLYFAASGLVHTFTGLDTHYFFIGDQDWLPVYYAFSRNYLSLSFAVLCGHCSVHGAWIWAGFGASLAASLYVGHFAQAHWRLLFDLQMYWYVLTTVVVTLDLARIESATPSSRLLRHLAVAWLLIQLIVLFRIITGASLLRFNGVPWMIAVATIVLTYVRYGETARRERVELATTRILGAIEASSDLRSTLDTLARLVADETHFRRVSAYIDAFCLGREDSPGRSLIRVMDKGYRKDTSMDAVIRFDEGRGACMREAMNGGKAALRRGGRDGAWFTVVPLSRMACINFSDDRESDAELAHESLEVLTRLQPALSVLDSKLADLASRQGHALERLRSVYGDGKNEVEAGAVFTDISDYSVLTERYGAAFANFVASVYFPALVKSLASLAVPEFVRGDELYMLSLKEFLPQGVTPREAAVRTAAAVRAFASAEGARLCADHGLPALKLSTGANAGKAWLVTDPIKVRTAGQVVNDAKRLQEAAPSGGLLIHASLAETARALGIAAGEPAPVLVKKNLIMACDCP